MDCKDADNERWLEAQEWERAYWDKMTSGAFSFRNFGLLRTLVRVFLRRGIGNDSNLWWAEKFENYHYIPKNIYNCVEFGCGPFTNLRIIFKNRTAKYIFASDPLARHYINYSMFQLAKKWRSGEYLIDDHPLEEAPFASNFFDLVVCINVLDHVKKPDLCMTQLLRVLASGGILILGQDLTTESDLMKNESIMQKNKIDIGHPHIFPDHKYFLEYLHVLKPILNKVLTREEGRAPDWHSGTFIFAGIKS